MKKMIHTYKKMKKQIMNKYHQGIVLGALEPFLLGDTGGKKMATVFNDY